MIDHTGSHGYKSQKVQYIWSKKLTYCWCFDINYTIFLDTEIRDYMALLTPVETLSVIGKTVYM